LSLAWEIKQADKIMTTAESPAAARSGWLPHSVAVKLWISGAGFYEPWNGKEAYLFYFDILQGGNARGGSRAASELSSTGLNAQKLREGGGGNRQVGSAAA
jgi:hypothetical protein